MPLEMQSAADAARNASPEHLLELRRLQTDAGRTLTDDERLSVANMAFHQQIARASGNDVIAQLLGVLYELFRDEQRLILNMGASRERRSWITLLDNALWLRFSSMLI